MIKDIFKENLIWFQCVQSPDQVNANNCNFNFPKNFKKREWFNNHPTGPLM